jgi:hypothetical protein
MASCLASSFSIFSDCIIPEGIMQRRLGTFYAQHPIMSRLIASPIALISGTIKTLLFPVICAVGLVALPIIALLKNEGKTGPWIGAWCFCLLGVVLSGAFIASVAFQLPLIVSSGLFVSFLAISIIFHVYTLVKEPPALALENVDIESIHKPLKLMEA